MLLYDLFDGLPLDGRSEYRSPTLCLLMNQDYNTIWDNKMVKIYGIYKSRSFYHNESLQKKK